MTIKLSESGFDTGMTFDQVCDEIEAAGYDSPRELGYTEEETTFYGADYARSELLDPGETWETEACYWSARPVD